MGQRAEGPGGGRPACTSKCPHPGGHHSGSAQDRDHHRVGRDREHLRHPRPGQGVRHEHPHPRLQHRDRGLHLLRAARLARRPDGRRDLPGARPEDSLLMAQAAPVAPPELELTYEMPQQGPLLTDAGRRIRRNRLALVGGVIIGILFITALISIVWTPYPTWLQAVGPTYHPPSGGHPLGLDQAGRDILSRIMGGALITVEVGIGSAIIVSLIGIPLGLLAGFYRGSVDTVISFFINIWYGIPDLLVALILVFVLSDALHLIPRGLLVIVIAFSLTRWMDVARLVRGQALALRERQFVEAARMSGARAFALLFLPIFPSAPRPLISH